jgi:hypothetical protein
VLTLLLNSELANAGFLPLLAQLTTVGDVSQDEFTGAHSACAIVLVQEQPG